jgi:hypothetical protein
MTCSYRTCGNGLPTARLPERSESVRLSGTLCRALAVLAVTGARRRHPVAGADAPGPGRAEAHHHGPPRRLGHHGGGGAGKAADAVRSVLDEFLPGLYLSSVLSSAPRKRRSGAERTAARGHGGRAQTRSGQRAGRRRPRSRPGARGGGPVRRLREGGLPARLTVHPHEIVGVFTGGHRGTFRDGRVSRPGNLGGHETWEDAGLPPPKRPGTTSTETKICSQLAC